MSDGSIALERDREIDVYRIGACLAVSLSSWQGWRGWTDERCGPPVVRYEVNFILRVDTIITDT